MIIEAFFGHESETIRPYIHTDYERNPLTFIWRAKTPAGRWSKYYHRVTVYGNQSPAAKLRKALKQEKPVMRPGYTWTEPLVYSNNPLIIEEGE